MSTAQQFSASRASRNALLLMFRTIVGVLIGFLTSRIVYNALGTEDYGVNVVVGGLLPAFTFISGVLATATSRFLTFEIGRGDEEKIRHTFTATFWAHLMLAVILVVICEIGGLYLLQHQLQIPSGRESAATFALQCSIVGVFFGIIQVPYSAVLVANERFKQFAYFSLLGSILALVGAFFVKYTHCDKLIVYVLFTAGNNAFCTLLNCWYCQKHHPEANLQRRVQWSLLRPILNYSAWELFGNGCSALYNQAKNFWVNKFFGVRYNASVSVANTINGSIAGFTGPISTAFAPSITKQYAQGNYTEMARAMQTYVRFTLILSAMFAVPISLNAEILFQLWLGSVPDLAPALLHSFLLSSFIVLMNGPLHNALIAIGRMELSSLTGGLYMLFLFVLVYYIFDTTHDLVLGFFVMAIGELGQTLRFSWLVHHYAPQIPQRMIFRTYLKIILSVAISSLIPYAFHLFIHPPILHLMATTLIHIVSLSALSYFMVFNKQEQRAMRTKVSYLVRKFI